MCFDHDSRPPIQPIEGGALDSRELTLQARDGARLSAFLARAADPVGTGIVILPDVRGLHRYYEDLALRFAEHGIEALAIDYFGRTAGLGRRDGSFEYMPHVQQTTWAGLQADIGSAAAFLRTPDGGRVERLFTIGFCFGGRVSFLAATLGLELAGVIGFYGSPTGPGRNDIPAPADLAGSMRVPVLGIFGGADPGIPAASIRTFEASLDEAGVTNRMITYENAPHSFFDRKADEFVRSAEQAWIEVLEFTGARTASSV